MTFSGCLWYKVDDRLMPRCSEKLELSSPYTCTKKHRLPSPRRLESSFAKKADARVSVSLVCLKSEDAQWVLPPDKNVHHMAKEPSHLVYGGLIGSNPSRKSRSPFTSC